MNGSSGATDGERPVQVHGRWTMPASSPRWSLQASLLGASSGDWVLCFGPDGGDALLGWTADELRAVSAHDLLHPDDRDRLDDAAACLSDRTRRFVPLDLRVIARDSRYWWTRWHLTGAADGACEAHGTEYLGPDPGRGSLIASWRWNVDTDVVSWSPELLDMFALHVGPPASYRTFLATVHDDDRDHVAERLRQAVVDGLPFRYTFRCPTDDTHDRWFHAAGRSIVDADGARHVSGLVRFLNPPSTWATAERIIGCG